MLMVTMVMFFAGFMMMGYGLTSDLSYTDAMQTLMGYGCIIMLAGLVGFIGTLIYENTQTI